MSRSLLDLPPKARPVFFCVYLVLQTLILARAQWGSDFAFGFQMFNESSELKILLIRRVEHKGHDRFLPVQDGAWRARDAHGVTHDFHWADRVRDGVLGNLDHYEHASYGIQAQLFRLQFALRDVAQHIPDDHETRELIAVVDTVKNGGEPQQVRLQAARP